jgi:hypothetical protein
LNITTIVSELKAQRKRIDGAIKAIEGLSSNGAARDHVPKSVTVAKTQKSSRLTAAGRKRLSELMKKRWAERRKKAVAKR